MSGYGSINEEAGKSYSFLEDHDKNRPVQMWFQESTEGVILFIVFYAQACRWSRCLGCNLPSQSSESHVDYKAMINQIDHIFADPEVVRRSDDIRKVIISNNGSILDENTFSSTALMYLMAKINLNLPSLTSLCLETRPEYIDFEELEFLSRALHEREIATETPRPPAG
ncbi:hypothetical protein ACFL2A_03710, partial [Thermodesulfobacteriota bacterium]